MVRPPPAARTTGLDNPVMRTFQSALGRTGLMSFDAAFMDPAGFDFAGVRAVLAYGEASESFQYRLAEGSPRLRAAIVERMAAIGVSAVTDEIIVTTRATPALDLLCNALLDPDDVVPVERPTHAMPLQRFALAQARVISVPCEEDGLDPLALEAAVVEHRPKLIYTIPTAAIYFERVDWAQRTSELRAVYAAPMRAMVEGLAEVLPPGPSFTRSQGGVFVWVVLPDGWSTAGLVERATQHGLVFVFLADVPDDRSLRLSISNHTPESVGKGLARLRSAIAATPALTR